MNGGNRTRGQADGFDLDFLAKIRDIKMNSGGTLLLFIARQYILKYQIDVLEDEPKCPVPNITSILKGNLWIYDVIRWYFLTIRVFRIRK